MIGIWISSKEIYDYQLMPCFWKGDFGTGYVKYDFQGDLTDFYIIILPYIRDIVFLIIGYIILKKKSIKQPFTAGLILIMLVLSPLYDISNNYLAYIIGSLNDFNAIKITTNGFFSNLIGISFMIMTIFLTFRIMILSNGYPDN
jgi:small-conductance mechanosensitive channel